MIAPTKKPSSRLKITPHAVQRVFRLKGFSNTAERPQAGQRSLRHRPSVRTIVRGSLFILTAVESQCWTQLKKAGFAERNRLVVTPSVCSKHLHSVSCEMFIDPNTTSRLLVIFAPVRDESLHATPTKAIRHSMPTGT